MFLIAGLGNPGSRYISTRHNIGFMVVDRVAEKEAIRLDSEGYYSVWGRGNIAGHDVVIAKPLTFMNLSGRAVAALSRAFSIPPESIIVVCDDCDLPLGRLRIRKRGGSGGHRGLESIIDHLGSTDFPRVRVGVGRPPEGDLTHYVLSPFKKEEAELLDDVIERAALSIRAVIEHGIEYSMNRFNAPQGAVKSE